MPQADEEKHRQCSRPRELTTTYVAHRRLTQERSTVSSSSRPKMETSESEGCHRRSHCPPWWRKSNCSHLNSPSKATDAHGHCRILRRAPPSTKVAASAHVAWEKIPLLLRFELFVSPVVICYWMSKGRRWPKGCVEIHWMGWATNLTVFGFILCEVGPFFFILFQVM